MKLSKQTVAHLEYILSQVAEAPHGCPDTRCAFCGEPLDAPHGLVSEWNGSVGATVGRDCPVTVAKDLIERGVLSQGV